MGGVRLTPISRLSAACCVDLELRPLPSTGVTRRRRYYGPIRHPGRPGLSLAGVRLRVTRPHRSGFPVLRGSPCTDMPSSLPRWPAGSDRSWDGVFQPFPCSPAATAFPLLVQGRRTHWTFRGLLNVHSRYGLPARGIAKATPVSRRLRRFRYLHRRSDSYRLERPSCRVGVAPTEDPHLFTAHTSCVPVSGPFPVRLAKTSCVPVSGPVSGPSRTRSSSRTADPPKGGRS